MPRTIFPPTPAPSTDIVGKENVDLSNAGSPIFLPPSAMDGRGSVSSDSRIYFDESHLLLSPTSPKLVGHFRNKSAQLQSKTSLTDITLPPPPTRSRKIIQMKPGPQREHDPDYSTPIADKPKAAPKRKQASASSAGKKIARKTAHSIIERRRRSKMNEEFGVLKDMIPACDGQEMHKLAILQASIEYLRYLEQCVADLQTGRATRPQSSAPSSVQHMDHDTPIQNSVSSVDDQSDRETDDEEDDVEMEISGPEPHYSAASIMSTSPSFRAFDSLHHQPSHIELPPSNTYRQDPQRFSQTAIPLPVSQHPSPMIASQISRDLDHEASAALLMLNATDRRLVRTSDFEPSGIVHDARWKLSTSRNVSGIRGMSVQDLLRS